MMKPFGYTIFLFFTVLTLGFGQSHPSIELTSQEADELQASLGKYPLIDSAFNVTKAAVDAALAKPIEVPPPGEGGSSAHERHKLNYREMHGAGVLFAIIGNVKYAQFIKDMLNKYADMYPTLGPNPYSNGRNPGKIFHQMLNETVWLVNTAMAYDCIFEWLTPADRQRFEQNIFIPMVEWFTQHNTQEFDLIHNHGIWAQCSVGLIGMVMKRDDWVKMALYGTDGSGKGGFLKQLDILFSPDGYYMEGPYYARYAMRPLYKFADALERTHPDLKIYHYRDSILKKAYYAAVGAVFPNGVFFPINDASRSMNISEPGVVLATSLVFDRYGADQKLYALAEIQGQAILNGSGLKLAKAMASLEKAPPFAISSTEYRDGTDGNEGGLGILRHGTGKSQTVLLMRYGVHGMWHGHFDKLHFIYYDQGREIIPDYGFSRWINVEPKNGGRYLPENMTYARQTIAHNTVVVDEKCQNDGSFEEADMVSGVRHFFDCSDPQIQAMSAYANDHYLGVAMKRSMFLIDDKRLDYPIVVDLYRLTSDTDHQYDYPVHLRGQLITTSFKYQAFSQSWQPLGNSNGYEHIWRTAEADLSASPKITWLDGQRYYSTISNYDPGTKVIFGVTGANDPNLNLRIEPLYILRKSGKTAVFATVIEPHGYFDEVTESSDDARGTIENVQILGDVDDGTVLAITGKNGYRLTVKVTNDKTGANQKHCVGDLPTDYRWEGDYEVDFE